MTAEPAAVTRHTATYPGRADQVHRVRRAVARHLAGCPAAADAVLIASELASNAILHSRSKTGYFTVRAELHPDHVRIEAEDDAGGLAPVCAFIIGVQQAQIGDTMALVIGRQFWARGSLIVEGRYWHDPIVLLQERALYRWRVDFMRPYS